MSLAKGKGKGKTGVFGRPPRALRLGRISKISSGLLGAIVVLEAAFAIVAKGAFFRPASSLVLVTSALLLGLGYLFERPLVGPRPEDIAILALAACWWITGAVHGNASSFLPFGASLIAIAGSAAAVRSLDKKARRLVATSLTVIVTAFSVAGIVACELRISTWSTRAHGLWRLSGSITYANAAGLLLAMGLCLVLDEDRPQWRSFGTSCCVAGLVATQSRGAVLACAVGLFLMRKTARKSLLALGIGLVAGLVVVATSRAAGATLGAAVVICVLLACSPLVTSLAQRQEGWLRRRKVVAAALASLAILVAIITSASVAVARLDRGSDVGRIREWHSAINQAFSSPWIGVGPDQLLVGPSGRLDYFAHNEVLQVACGAGVLGVLVLCGVLHLNARRIRNQESTNTASAAALAAFAVAGLFDFVWHVPALGILAGVCLGFVYPAATGERSRGRSEIASVRPNLAGG
jgi:O-antigen ligase